MMHPRDCFARSAASGCPPRWLKAVGRAGALLFLAALVCWSPGRAQTGGAPVGKSAGSGSALSRGIALYEAGRYEDSLNELRTVVDSGASKGRALAYYYAARIRMQKGNLPAARINLLNARGDSAGFHDAMGLLAWVNLKLGNRTDALIEWRAFVKAVGSPDSGPVTVDSIVLPEEYRRKLARPVPARSVSAPAPSSPATRAPSPVSSPVRKETLAPNAAPAPAALALLPDTAAVRALPDTVARAFADTANGAPRSIIGKPDSAGVNLTDIDRRIESQIRRGYYGVGITAALLLAGLIGTAWRIRKRRKSAPRLTFSDTVDRALDAVDREEGLLDGEELEREFERRRMEIMEESPRSKAQSQKAEESPGSKTQNPMWGTREDEGNRPDYGRREPEPRLPISSARGEESIFPGFESGDSDPRVSSSASPRTVPGAESGRRPITEEVKALVARMAREGHSSVDIARIADLTRTEVELILAVRAHTVEQLIETAREEDDAPDRGALYRAIGELHAEGRAPQEIARRLSISATEVNLALAMMARKGKGRR